MARASEPTSDPLDVPLTVGALLMYTSLTNVHAYLCVHGYVLHRRSPMATRRRHQNYVRAMFLILFLSASAFAFDVANFYASSSVLDAGRRRLSWLGAFLHFFIGLTHLSADGLLVWRCYLVWATRWWIGLAPLLPHISALVVGALVLFSSVRCALHEEDRSSTPTNHFCVEKGTELYRGLYYLIATSVNVMSTSLICGRLVFMKRRIERLASPAPLPYTRVTSLLLESALPFTVVGLLTGITALANTREAYHGLIFASRVWTVSSALAAQSIIYRVICGISWVKTPEISERTQSIHFSLATSHELSERASQIP
ncbi:hypothetical protein BKA70DRAFT_1307580 [Coprinopsis sp. MPI-PUGE-AT-0042]|nr:hypothetical protein BKA70DRAFT_1307580 [Coprinopsis sp. MPI-PUGE-AT-0042]